jgi:hypothetical protein
VAASKQKQKDQNMIEHIEKTIADLKERQAFLGKTILFLQAMGETDPVAEAVYDREDPRPALNGHSKEAALPVRAVRAVKPKAARSPAVAGRALPSERKNKPNGLGKRIFAALPSLASPFNAPAVAKAIGEDERVVAAALSYAYRSGKLKLFLAGKPGVPAQYTLLAKAGASPRTPNAGAKPARHV